MPSGHAFFRIWSFVLPILILTSCYVPRNVSVQILAPPDTAIIQGRENLLLINAVLGDEQINDTLKFDDLRFPAPVYNQLTWRAIYGFADFASGSPLVNNILFDSVPWTGGDYQIYRESQVGYGPKNNAGVSLLLNKLIFGDSLQRMGAFPVEDGSADYLFGVNLFIPLEARWTLYYSETRSFFDFTVRDTLSMQGYGTSYNAAVASLPSIRDNLWDFTDYLGNKSAERIFPAWEDVNRIYFIHLTNKEMVKAELFAKENQWKEAARIWNNLSRSGKPGLAARAAFNMALAAELNDDLDLAEQWLMKSLEIKPYRMTRDYLKVIRRRKDDRKKLFPR